MTPEFPYVQLPGTYRGFLRKASLWEGADHILSVSGTRFNEEYRRFYYRDIQALLLEKRARSGSIGWWIILLAILVVSLIATVAKDPPYSWIALVVSSLLLVIRLDLTFRRSCRCTLQTAVSREQLPSLIRRTPAQAAIARLQSRISAEQGDLPNEIPQSEEELAASLGASHSSNSAATAALEQAAVLERRRAAIRGVNLSITALFVLLFNSVFTFWLSSGVRLMSQANAAFAGYAFITAAIIPVCLALQSIASLRALTSLRVLLIGIIVLAAVRAFFSLAIVPIGVLFSSRQSIPFALFQRYYTNVNGSLQLAFAAGGILLIFAKWETYRRGELSRS